MFKSALSLHEHHFFNISFKRTNCQFKVVTGIYSLTNFVVFHSSEQIAESQVKKQFESN
jgi:hypothetical protein